MAPVGSSGHDRSSTCIEPSSVTDALATAVHRISSIRPTGFVTTTLVLFAAVATVSKRLRPTSNEPQLARGKGDGCARNHNTSYDPKPYVAHSYKAALPGHFGESQSGTHGEARVLPFAHDLLTRGSTVGGRSL
jgi:hypothetical protein